MVVLSPSMQVLHLNRQALILIRDVVPAAPEAQLPNNRTHVLPPALINLAGTILRVLRRRHERGEKGQFEIRHVANGSDMLVSIRGVGVPNRQGVEYAHIVLLLTGAQADHSEDHRSLRKPALKAHDVNALP